MQNDNEASFEYLTLSLTGRRIHAFLYLIWMFFVIGGCLLLDRDSKQSPMISTVFAAFASLTSLVLSVFGVLFLHWKKETRKWLYEKDPKYGKVHIATSSLWLIRLFPLAGLAALIYLKLKK